MLMCMQKYQPAPTDAQYAVAMAWLQQGTDKPVVKCVIVSVNASSQLHAADVGKNIAEEGLRRQNPKLKWSLESVVATTVSSLGQA